MTKELQLKESESPDERCLRPLSRGAAEAKTSPLLIGRSRSALRRRAGTAPGCSRATWYHGSINLPTPKTKRPHIDMMMPRTHVKASRNLSSLTQERNWDLELQMARVDMALGVKREGSVQEDAAPRSVLSSGPCSYGRETQSTLHETIELMRSDHSTKKEEKVEVAVEDKQKLQGATSVPKFNNQMERNKWWGSRVEQDISKYSTANSDDLGAPAAELAKALPPSQISKIDKCRKDVTELRRLKQGIKERAARLSKQGAGTMEYGSTIIIERNIKEASIFCSPVARAERRQAEYQKRQRQRENLLRVTQEKDKWHRQVMMNVSKKADLAYLAQQKRREDATRDRENERSSKLLVLCTVTVRGAMMLNLMLSGRKIRELATKRNEASKIIQRFYRRHFMFIHFLRYKHCRLKLGDVFKRFLPNWRMRRNLLIAKKIVAFCMSFSGAGGTVAAIKAYRSKILHIQLTMREYMVWKRKVIYGWQQEYTDTHEKLLLEWEELRKQAYQKASKEGLDLDEEGNPKGLPKRLEPQIDLGTSCEQLFQIFKRRRGKHRESLVEYRRALQEFQKKAQMKLRMRLAQKMIQGDRFDILKILEEEEKKGEQELLMPDRPEYPMQIPEDSMKKLVYFGSDVMSAKAELLPSPDAEYLVAGLFKSRKQKS